MHESFRNQNFPRFSLCETGWRQAGESLIYKIFVQMRVVLILFSAKYDYYLTPETHDHWLYTGIFIQQLKLYFDKENFKFSWINISGHSKKLKNIYFLESCCEAKNKPCQTHRRSITPLHS